MIDIKTNPLTGAELTAMSIGMTTRRQGKSQASRIASRAVVIQGAVYNMMTQEKTAPAFGEMWWTDTSPHIPVSVDEIIELAGTMQPYVVDSQAEKDWLDAMQLMTGKAFVVLIDGIHENKTGMPPTFLKLKLELTP